MPGSEAPGAEQYEAALAAEPGWVAGHFYLANCYDHLYQPSQAGKAYNDAYLQKAIQHYQIAAERDPDAKIRKLAMEYQVAAFSPEKLNDPSRAEPIVQRMIEMDPADSVNYVALAKLYEDAGRYDDAEAALLNAVGLAPQNPAIRKQLAGFYNRVGDFAKTMDALHAAADLDSNNPESYQLVASYYWEKAQRDRRISHAQKLEYIQKGIEAEDRALAINADYIDALTYKNVLLRMKANETADPAERVALVAEADSLRARAMELSRLRAAPPPPLDTPTVDGMVPVRVGPGIRMPTKFKHVDPIYPDAAVAADIRGVVIVEVVLDTQGHVWRARVLRSIPALDAAALEAVRQWEFTPTSINGVATPLIMTVTVTFSR